MSQLLLEEKDSMQDFAAFLRNVYFSQNKISA